LNGDSSDKNLRDVVQGQYRVVYLSPEKAEMGEVKKCGDANFIEYLIVGLNVTTLVLLSEYHSY
jgi:hypothetical protein